MVEHLASQIDDRVQRLIQVVALQAQLGLGLLFSVDSLVVELEKLRADSEGIDVLEADGEKHLSVTLQFF